MDKTQATEIQEHLLAAAAALSEASAAIFKLDKEDRVRFARPLSDLGDCLHFEMLPMIYARYPELRPPAEIPEIDSDLRWEDVTLPSSVSEADLDAIIFSMLKPRLQKTAMVIGKAKDHCSERALPIDVQMIAARIEALAEADRIECAGDLRYWRHSEVGLKG